MRARVGKKWKNTSEGSGDITFSNPAVVGVANRVKILAAQGSDGSFSMDRENDILTAAIETPEHRGWVRSVFSSFSWGKGFGEEFARMYRKKSRNKRSDHMMDITFKTVVHALRLSCIKIPKMYFFLPNYQHLSVVARKNMCMTTRKNLCMTARKMRVAESKTIAMPMRTK
jgi:hypothetical protein